MFKLINFVFFKYTFILNWMPATQLKKSWENTGEFVECSKNTCLEQSTGKKGKLKSGDSIMIGQGSPLCKKNIMGK